MPFHFSAAATTAARLAAVPRGTGLHARSEVRVGGDREGRLADTDVGTLIDGPAAELVSNRVRAAVAIGATLHAADSAAAPRSRKAVLDEHASPPPSERL